MNDLSYPRDMIGYGAHPPRVRWPNQARIAVQFVINYEEGAENNILHGDAASEASLSEIIGAPAYAGMRHMNMESIYEYGSRAGFWRLYRLFERHRIPVTMFAVAMAMARNPEAVAAMREGRHEIASHGYRWIDYQQVSEAVEQEHLERAIAVHTELTGSRPLGFYLGRTSVNTHRLVANEGGFVYHADSYADDLPYWDTRHGRAQLVVPYTLDANDMRFATSQGFNSAEQFFQYLKDTFDVLYTEGEQAPRMMSVGLHCRLAGRPGRLAGLERFIEHAASYSDVWFATRLDIAHCFADQFPAPTINR